MDMWTLKEVLLNHIYDRYHRLPQPGLVVDIGAGIGDFCLLAGRTAKTVIGYDPDPNRATLCRQNLRRNHINNVSFIADTATSLDQIISRHHLKTIDFLKIDCEGCEYPLLLSASPTTLQSIKYLAAEIHLFNPKMQSQFNKLQQHLTRNGFTLKIDPNPVHSNLGYLFAQRSQQT
jgi:predicted O-methyltransferase YrrM